jgi:hypothetical protein
MISSLISTTVSPLIIGEILTSSRTTFLDNLLLENGSNFLLEDGSYLLKE